MVLYIEGMSKRITELREEDFKKYLDWSLDNFCQIFIDQVKQVMSSGIFKHATGQSLNKWQYKVLGNGKAEVTNANGYLKYQNEGVHPHAMKYLVSKKDPNIIPLGGGGKGTMFRKATAKNIAAGKWHHPGYKGKFFIEKAVDQAIESAQKQGMEMFFTRAKGEQGV